MDNIALIRIALQVLSDKVLTIISLMMVFGLSCWTMYEPTLERLGMSAFFALFSFCVLNTKEKDDEKL